MLTSLSSTRTDKRPAILEPVMIKPGLDGKRVAGELQIHDNGIRYSTHSGQKVGELNMSSLFSDLSLSSS